MKKTTHDEQIKALRRIEGQVRGLQRMIADKKYCIDIITQLQATVSALHAVSDKILVKHIDGCVVSAFKQGSAKEKDKKIAEIMRVVKRIRKI